MSFEPPRNPYASSSRSSSSSNNGQQNQNDAHHALTRVLHHPSPEAIKRFRQVMVDRAWTLPLAEKLVGAILRDKKHSDGLVWLLIQVLPQWDDVLIYATVASHPEQDLLSELVHWILSQPARPVGFVALVHVWEALDRIQSYSSWTPRRIDTAWWHECSTRDDRYLFQMAHIAIEVLLNRDDASTGESTAIEDSAYSVNDIRASCSSFLCCLLKHDIKDWMYEIDDLTPLVQQLTLDTQPLDEHDVTSASTIRLAFGATGLLCCLHWKHHAVSQSFVASASVVDYVSKVAFRMPSLGAASPSGPGWVCDPLASSLQSPARNLLSLWSLSQQDEPSEQYWLPLAEATWAGLLESKDIQEYLPTLCFLLTTTSCRLSVRRCLLSILTPHLSQQPSQLVEACRVLVASFLNHCQSSDLVVATASASVLHTLLCDRLETERHDELSRSLWAAMDSFPLQRLIDGTIKLASGDVSSSSTRACQPLLLCMLDIVQLLSTYPEGSRASLLDVGTQRIESLIDMVASTGAEMSPEQQSVLEEMDEETPPTNNLSRLDTSQVSIENDIPEKPRRLKGLAKAIRVAAATILVRIGIADLSDNAPADLHLLRTHTRNAVYDFIANSFANLIATNGPSLSWRHRVVRLQSLVASLSTENESLIASSFANVDMCHAKERQDLHQELMEYDRKLDDARADARASAVEKNRYKTVMRSQALLLERDMDRIKKKATAESSHLVEVHARERSKAEQRAADLSERLEEAEAMREEAQNRAETYRESESDAKMELQEALSKLEDMQEEMQEQKELAETQELESTRMRQELAESKNELLELKSEHKTARSDLDATRRALSETKRAYGSIQEEVEAIFANLSALAQMYQIKEEEIATIVERKDRAIQEARRSSDTELRRNEELVQNQTRLELENERLTKKLARAKEKLEAERQARHDDEQRRKRLGPVSYINQLHTSSHSSDSRRDRSVRVEKGSHSEARSMEKENSRSFSSASRRQYR